MKKRKPLKILSSFLESSYVHFVSFTYCGGTGVDFRVNANGVRIYFWLSDGYWLITVCFN